MTHLPNQTLLALGVAIILAGCSPSGPCQATFATYNCGDCIANPAICQPQDNPTKRADCEMACSSTTDQAALLNLVNCLNGIPKLVGTCSSSTQTAWYRKIGVQSLSCVTSFGGQLSTGCVSAVVLGLDGGVPDGG